MALILIIVAQCSAIPFQGDGMLDGVDGMDYFDYGILPLDSARRSSGEHLGCNESAALPQLRPGISLSLRVL